VPEARTGFAVLCHRNPRQVEQLLEVLSPNPVALHVDARCDPAMMRALRVGGRRPHVTLVSSRATPWASIGLVDASLACARELLGTGATHVAVLSGQDLPLVTVDEIDRFVGGTPKASFLCWVPIPFRHWGRDGGRSRFQHFNVRVGRRRVSIPARRRLPHGWEPFGGPMQWCLHHDLVRVVLDTLDTSPSARRYFRHTWIPDEIVVPTIAMNSPLRDTVIRENLWYIRWREGSSHPETLTTHDLDDLRQAAVGPCDTNSFATRKLFARKFDETTDADAIAQLARELA
jgi:Core-2/I-Branching enzyme